MRLQLFTVDRYGATWKATNPSAAVIRKTLRSSLESPLRYAVELRRA